MTHYYQTFDTNRAGLQSLYQDGSMLSFENEQFMGMQAIMTKLTVRVHPPRTLLPAPVAGLADARAPTSAQTLQFQTVQHQVTTTDCQPSLGNGIVVFITGKLVVRPPPALQGPVTRGSAPSRLPPKPFACARQVDGGTNPLMFAQTFMLAPTAAGSWYIHNDVFRLNYT